MFKNDLETKEMQNIPYASAVGSLMYAQVCPRPYIKYIVGMLGRYLSNRGLDHWKAAKQFMRYLQRTRFHAHIQKIRSIEDHWLF